MSIAIIRNRSQLVTNARSYQSLVLEEIYRLPADLKKTAQETITRTQSWIAIRDIDTSGSDIWLPFPQKFGGIVNSTIHIYEKFRKGGIDLQRIDQSLRRMGCYEANKAHSAWSTIREYASNLGLSVREGASLWIINGEDLDYIERVTLDIITDIADVRKLSNDARNVLSNRLLF